MTLMAGFEKPGRKKGRKKAAEKKKSGKETSY